MCLVQACRTKQPPPGVKKRLRNFFKADVKPGGASASREAGNTHDYIRIMAASKGEVAYRNFFLPLLVGQLGSGDDLLTAFRKTEATMQQPGMCSSAPTQQDGRPNTPELKGNLTKRLPL